MTETFLRPFARTCLTLALLFSVAVCAAQDRAQLPPPVPQPSAGADEGSGLSPDQQKQLEKKVNLQRQKEIKTDTDKILELATQLKQSVDKSNENTLSLDVIRKAEQIEKLAKSVKDKMKGS